MNGLEKKYYIIYIFLGYFAVSMLLQKSFVTEFPRHIHAWAHCDHYAISKGFINNGFDFFHPETLVYNKQFENEDGTSNNSKITAIDFPINNYIVAVLMKIFNSDAPAIFRLYTLIVACFGLSFLFLISLHFTKQWIISFCIPVIVVFTPVYLDYQVGFLPSITSLSLLFFSSYFFIKYKVTNKTTHLIWVAIGLSFATLIRTPYAIHLIALAGFLFFDQIIKKKFQLKEWIIVLSAFSLPTIYFLFNGYLRSKYGSIFLSSPMIVEDWNQAKEIIKSARDIWKDHYFNEFQYIILYVTIIASIAKLFLSKYHISNEGKSLISWFGISFFGVICYASLMIPQYKDHDYYFLDTFYPVVFVLLSYALSKIKYQSFSNRLASLVLTLVMILILSSSNSSLKGRRELKATDMYSLQYNAYSQLEDLLLTLGVPSNERLMVIDAFAPNMPFILSNRSGYALIYRSQQDIINSFEFDYKYIVVSKSYFFNRLILDFENFHQEVNLIGKTDKLLLFERSKNSSTLDLSEYINTNNPIVSFMPNKENCNNIHLNNEGISDLHGKEFGLTFNHKLPNDRTSFLVHVTGEIKSNENNKVVFVVDIKQNEENAFYSTSNLSQFATDSNLYDQIDFYVFANDISPESNGSFYIYNPSKEDILLKNIKIELF